MENFKRSVKRFVTRLTIIGLVVVCGAIAIAQVQKQNDANAADNGQLTPLQFAKNDINEPQPNQPGAVIGLPVHEEPARLNVGPAEPLERAAAPRQTSHNDSLAIELASHEDTIEAPNEFVRDDQVAPAQASSETFSNGFDSPFPTAASASDDAADSPPQFGGFDDGPPSFDDTPEFSRNEAPSAIANGPTAPDTSDFNAGFPGDDFDQGFPSPNASAPPTATPPFGQDTAQSPDPRMPSNNRLRQPGASPRFGELPEASTRAGQSAPRASQTTTTPIAQQERVVATPPANSFDNTSFGSYDNTDDSFATDNHDNTGYGSENTLPEPITAPGAADPASAANSLSLPSTGTPAPELNGLQTASISVQKTAPTQAHIGEPATFKIRIRNNSTQSVDRVIIRDQIPKGTELVSTDPPAKQASTGGIFWEIDTLRAGEERTVKIQVMPAVEQLIGSVAEVSFTTMASAQTEVRRPMLKIEHTTKPEVMLGDTVRFAIIIENPGTGTAKGVTIEEDVPAGLSHSKGPRLDYKVGDIPPGGRRRLELSLKAAEVGTVTNLIRAQAANGLQADHQVNLQVVAPDLKVLINGPSTRYLERKATYTVELQNRGTAAAENVNLRVQLPRGLNFVSTSSKGRYDAATHSVRWLLRALEPNKGASVQLTVDPQQKGEFVLNAVATADRNLRDTKDHPLMVEGIAALMYEVVDQIDPIEVGGVTTYNIQVTNQGTKEANNIVFQAELPNGLEAVSPQGQAKYQVRGNLVQFQPIARLAAKQKASYAIQVRGRTAGDQRFKVLMTSSATPTPVVREESTRVYSDQ